MAIAATQQIKGSASKLIVMHGFLYYLLKNESDHTVMKSFFLYIQKFPDLHNINLITTTKEIKCSFTLSKAPSLSQATS